MNSKKGRKGMKATVLGIQNVNYVSKKTGNPVSGVTLHCSFKDPSVRGDAVDGIFVSDNLGLSVLADIKPGDSIDIETNLRGYVQNVTICK